MKTRIVISDLGTFMIAEFDGKLTVTASGGCPANRLLANIDFSESDLDLLATRVLDAWINGYGDNPQDDADAALENRLSVRIERGGKVGSANP